MRSKNILIILALILSFILTSCDDGRTKEPTNIHLRDKALCPAGTC